MNANRENLKRFVIENYELLKKFRFSDDIEKYSLGNLVKAKVSENFKNKNLAFARLLDLISTLSFEF